MYAHCCQLAGHTQSYLVMIVRVICQVLQVGYLFALAGTTVPELLYMHVLICSNDICTWSLGWGDITLTMSRLATRLIWLHNHVGEVMQQRKDLLREPCVSHLLTPWLLLHCFFHARETAFTCFSCQSELKGRKIINNFMEQSWGHQWLWGIGHKVTAKFTICDPGRSFKYCAYGTDHAPLVKAR